MVVPIICVYIYIYVYTCICIVVATYHTVFLVLSDVTTVPKNKTRILTFIGTGTGCVTKIGPVAGAVVKRGRSHRERHDPECKLRQDVRKRTSHAVLFDVRICEALATPTRHGRWR